MKDWKPKKQNSVKKKERIKPMREGTDVPENPDPHIDQDFPGYPHAPSEYRMINPKSKTEKKVAELNVKDGEKMDKEEKKKIADKDEQESDGSAGAFDRTESFSDGEMVSDDEKVY